MSVLRLPEGATPSIVRGAVAALTRARQRQPQAFGSGWESVLNTPVIYGFGLSERIESDRGTGELCVRFYVRRKVALNRLQRSCHIPRYVTIRTGSAGRVRIPTDVVPMPSMPVGHRVLPATSPIGHVSGFTAGAFGVAVLDGANEVFLLTCAHVAAPPFDSDPQDDAVESPPDPDGEPGLNTVGTVRAWTQLFPNGPVNLCDAALVAPLKTVQLTNSPIGGNLTAGFGEVTPANFIAGGPNLAIRVASPRGSLAGFITSLANDLPIRIFDQLYRFSGVVEHSAPTLPGDSGSAVVQVSTGRILGIHFAGLGLPQRGFYIPAAAIVRQFGDPRLRPLPS